MYPENSTIFPAFSPIVFWETVPGIGQGLFCGTGDIPQGSKGFHGPTDVKRHLVDFPGANTTEVTEDGTRFAPRKIRVHAYIYGMVRRRIAVGPD